MALRMCWTINFILKINERKRMSNEIFTYHTVLYIIWSPIFHINGIRRFMFQSKLNRNKRTQLEQQRNNLKENKLHFLVPHKTFLCEKYDCSIIFISHFPK